MTSAIDSFTYENSLHSNEKTDFIVTNKQFVFLTDSNQGNYPSNQILIDASSMATYDRFTNFSESWISLPLTLTATFNAGGDWSAAYASNDFALSLKNGIQTVIDNMVITINDQAVNNCTPFANEMISWELMKMSKDDVQNFADVINYGLDSAGSIRYNASPSANGLGETNNCIVQTAFSPVGGWANGTTNYNAGRFARMQSTSQYLDRAPATVGYYATTASQGFAWESHVYQNTQNAPLIYNINAILPLSILHPVFNKLCLTRGMKLKITLNTNCGSNVTVAVDTSLANPNGEFVAGGVTNVTTPHGTLPFMISPIGGGLVVNPANVTSINVALKIQNTD